MSFRFDYQIPASSTVPGTIFFLGLAIGTGFFAHSNERGVRLYGLITLTPDKATVFFWVLTAIFVLCTVLLGMMTLRAFGVPAIVAIEETHVIAPRASIRFKLLSIPYTSIKQVLVQKAQSQEIVIINSSVGQARLMSSGFKSRREFSHFKRALAERVNG
jgi:hypothetical protein